VVVTTGEDYADRLLYYGYDASDVEHRVSCPCPSRVTLEDWHRFPQLATGYERIWLLDPNPNYRYLRPSGALAQELDSYIFLPPVVFKGHSSATAVQRDLLAPFTTSDISVQLAVSAGSQPSDQEIIRLGTSVALRADELFPRGTRYHFTMGELYRFYGSEEKAVSYYNAAVADDPNYYPAYEGLALIHVARGEPKEALELAESLVARGIIHESYYHFLLGSLHYVEGDLAGALAEFRSAVRLDGDNVDYRLRLGDAYRALGRFDEAITQYDEVTRLDPSHVGAYSRRASVHRAEGRLTEAVSEYREALEMRPDSAFHHAMLADTYWHQGLMDDAVLEARAAVRLEEKDAAYHVLLGELYQALERIPEAIAEFETGVLLAPEFAPFQVELGAAYRVAGQHEEAAAAFERALELDPGNAEARHALQELR
jgi:tetratricopeptide (TPR) repeat protein